LNSNNLDVLITEYISKNLEENDKHFFSSKLAILDTIGCIIEASSHEYVIQFASKNNLSLNFKNPFKNLTVTQSYEDISWYLTVLTRWFDYNDTFLAKEWAHPSDNFGSIYSYFSKNNNYKFNDFTNALTKAYEIQGSLCLGTSLNKLGYDHVFYVKVASGSVFSYLVNNGDTSAVRRTINNILLDGPTLRAYRHFPNVGKRKSWAAADASRRGIELAIISSYKDEIYESVQNEDKWGFEPSFLENSKIEFGKDLNNWVIENILFKVLFPAEFHGQSAVEAAIKLSEEFNNNVNKIKKVNIYTHEPAVRIISNKEILKNASDRDHSLEYMVAAALLYGDLKYEMYEDSFEGFENINNLRKKIFVSEEPQFTKDYYEFSKRHISNSIEIVYNDNSTSEKITIQNPIGHPSRREEAIPLLKDKFLRNVESLFETKKASEVWDKILNLKKDDDLNKFFNILNEDE
jgi:2-methylcitrate dehydratase